MNKISTIWNKIPNSYKSIGALLVFVGINVVANRINYNISYAEFDENKGLVKYSINDTDGFLGYQILDENGRTLENIVCRAPENIDKIPQSAKGYIMLPPGKHTLTAS